MEFLKRIGTTTLTSVTLAALLAGCAKKEQPIPVPSLDETRAIAEEGFIYGLPIVMNYAVMAAEKSSPTRISRSSTRPPPASG